MTLQEPRFDELFREVILDHYRRPRNRGTLAVPTQHAEGLNPVCGDEIRLDLRIEDGLLCELAFSGSGCSISQSSASMMTEGLKGRTLAEADQMLSCFRSMMLEGAEPAPDLGDLEALRGVTQFPLRVKCAMLCWNVLSEGLKQAGQAA